jgi:hypothetical protein
MPRKAVGDAAPGGLGLQARHNRSIYSIYSILPPIRGELGTYPIALSDVMLPPQPRYGAAGRPKTVK